MRSARQQGHSNDTIFIECLISLHEVHQMELLGGEVCSVEQRGNERNKVMNEGHFIDTRKAI